MFEIAKDKAGLEWQRYEARYTAEGNEAYLTIGNFKDPALQSPKAKQPVKPRRGVIPGYDAFFESYYVRVFFDDISITPAFENGDCALDTTQVVIDSSLADTTMLVTDTLEVGEKVLLRNIYFEFDEATLTRTSNTELDRLVALLKRFPSLEIRINGHTDVRGTEAYTLALSERRTKSVVDYLVQRGIAPSRLSNKGFGESQPIGDDHAVNRRVEFEVMRL
jgi:outer membrane protein OmpA-like peptidoglycan-associated protein